MIPEDLTYCELLRQLKLSLYQVKNTYKTLKAGEWYRAIFNSYHFIILDDDDRRYEFSYTEMSKYFSKETQCLVDEIL